MGESLNPNQGPFQRLNVALAWAGILLASALPAIVWGEFTRQQGRDPLWLPATMWVQVGGLALLLLAALLWPAARPMRVPLVMLMAFFVGWRLLTPLVTESAAWTQWQAQQGIGLSLTTSRLQWLPPAALMTLVALGARRKRAELYLVKGDWSAPVTPDPLFPLRSWRWFPGMFVLLLLLTVATFVLGEFVLQVQGWVSTLGPDVNKAERVFMHFPGIAAGSFLNAASEEYIFRVMLLICLVPAVGTRHALGLTAVLFGLEHWPTAGFAIILTCYSGWIFAKSMTETGGWTWALVQHALCDLPIYALAAMARP